MPPSFRSHFGLALGFASALALSVRPATAAGPSSEDPDSVPVAPGIGRPAPSGRPNVTLDALVFPKDVASASALERHFRLTLKRAAHRADWGAERGAHIEYRVVVEELTVTESAGVLRVRCTALGRLPRGKSARSHLDFGGDPKKRRAVIERVLEIVARGVVTRLAALERERRRAASR
ncbi:MAG TPA: hypothetical protein VF103_01390 [Polyangiaceae bacterium]